MTTARVFPPDFPRPVPGTEFWPFWEACRRRELRIQRCLECGELRHHPRPYCPGCRSPRFDWALMSGRGRVVSWTICHPPVLAAFADRVPYQAIVVELEEGPFLVSNLLGCELDELAFDLPVQVCFVDVDDELTVPQFAPIPSPRP